MHREAVNTPSTTPTPTQAVAPLSATYARLVQEKMGEVLLTLLTQHDREAQDAAATALHWVVVTLATASQQQLEGVGGGVGGGMGGGGKYASGCTWAHTVRGGRFGESGCVEKRRGVYSVPCMPLYVNCAL